ncbi:integral membrane protein [Diaporthe amygdali]|uniref:uncharacterized protein n=1 Tax=Phomopsis amygdali TaxID=1214568 RepID=UPI0022FE8CF1|nr:uncharacterized protein J7T55_003953 [Diaporthe amygdali]KAJ0117535.1 integral membrane protein [Diaporthe amygdali]
MTIYAADTPETLNPLIVTTFFGAVALLSCIGRLYALKKRNQSFREEEYCIATALILTYVSLGIQWACVVYGGTGRHIADVDMPDVVLTLKLILPFEALYGLTLMFVKLAVLRFYSRIFAPSAWVTWSVRVTAAAVVMWMVSVVLETFLLCRPLAFNWDTTIDGVCGDRNAVFVIAGVTNMVTDFMVLLLPVPCIWKLQMPVGQKIGLLLVFCMGILITAISIVRLQSLMVISFEDPTWTLPMGLLWTVLEPELAIINANLPLMRRFFAKIIPKMLSFSRSKSTVQRSKKNDFEKLSDNGILLRTIGGGFVPRNNVVVGAENYKASEGSSTTGIIQERSIRVDYDNISDEDTGSDHNDRRARVSVV